VCCRYHSDPFTKLLLDGRLVGQTQVIKNNINPTWEETFTLPLALQASVLDSTLVLEVYDHDNVSDHDLLGVHTLSGEALRDLLCPAAAEADSDTSSAQVLPLEIEQKVKGKVKVVSCGEIVVQGCGQVSSVQPAGVGTGQQMQDGATQQPTEGAAEPTDPARKLVGDAYEELHNLVPEEYVLTVKTARGLINSDSLRNRCVDLLLTVVIKCELLYKRC
jgi:hypothetical protein